MSPTLTTFLFELTNFLLLAVALGWLLFRPIRQALAAQRAELDAAAETVRTRRAAAAAAQSETETARRSLHRELQQLRDRELVAARQRADQIVAAAHATAEHERETIRRQSAQLSEDELGRLAQAAAGAAAAAVAALLNDIQGPDLQSALVRTACEQLRRLPPAALGAVKVESAEPLAVSDRAALDAALGPAAAQALFAVDATLQIGVRISSGVGLIDASASGLTQFARQAFLHQLNATARPASLPKSSDEPIREHP